MIKKFIGSGKMSESVKLKPGKNRSLKDKPYEKNTKQLVRLIRVELDDGEFEVLITSLKDRI